MRARKRGWRCCGRTKPARLLNTRTGSCNGRRIACPTFSRREASGARTRSRSCCRSARRRRLPTSPVISWVRLPCLCRSFSAPMHSSTGSLTRMPRWRWSILRRYPIWRRFAISCLYSPISSVSPARASPGPRTGMQRLRWRPIASPPLPRALPTPRS